MKILFLNKQASFITLFISFALLNMSFSGYNKLHAEVRYVDDNIQIPLRSGASTEHRIVKFLSSGAKVELKNGKADDKWSEVSIASGTEGWVQSRYLKNTPAAKQLLRNSEAALAKLKEKNKEQKSTITKLQAELTSLKKEWDSLKKHSSSTDKELTHIQEISKNAIRLDHSNNELLRDNELLKASNEDALQQVTKLESNQQNQGILYGVLAVLLGIILGWIMPKMVSRKNDAWT